MINIYFFVMHPALLKDIFVFTLLGALAANYNICVGIYQSDIDEGNTRQQTIYFLFLAFWSVAIPALTYSMSSIETSVFFYFICVVTLCQCFSFYKVLNVRELKAYFQQTSSLLGLTVIAQFIYSMGIFAWISVDRLIILKQGPDLAVSQDHYAMVSVFASIFAGVASTVIIASRSRFLRVARQSNVQKICYAIGGTIIAISVVTYIINPSAIIAFPISLSLLGIVLSFLMIKALDTEHSMLLSGLILFGFSVLVFILLEYISLASGMLIILVAKFLLPLFVDKVLLFLKSRK
ncbi:hypothetical protein [Brumicola blandensis]|uniref:Uncharacterized protein n=1 Tax=Brumicola blandensis TaxID=3075611 RepID=A0AAW8QZV8_9ALTE|nr:hypothetical protein [Alteromonas sp. W409]MDT0582708.1 hypothetical protein [Alteromonas sp. W409]